MSQQHSCPPSADDIMQLISQDYLTSVLVRLPVPSPRPKKAGRSDRKRHNNHFLC